MKVALAQLNPTVGDVPGNTARIRASIASAAEAGADLVVFGELSILGYPARDLLYDPALIAANVRALESLAGECRDIAALVGFARPAPEGAGQPLEDAAALLADGRVRAVHVKSLLPNYDVYDDPRYFRPAGVAAHGADEGVVVHELAGRRVAVTICEDLWDPTALGRDLYGTDPIARLAGAGVDLVLNIAASGYERGKGARREDLLARQARRAGATILYVNQVGANDDMIFDGGTCAVSAEGKVLARAAPFREDLLLVDIDSGDRCQPIGDEDARLIAALKLGLRDYVRKAGFDGVVVGLAGDAPSAAVVVLAAEAVGADAVLALDLRVPARGGADGTSVEALAEDLGIRLRPVDLDAAEAATRGAAASSLSEEMPGELAKDVAERVRGIIVTACARASGRLALSPATKTDLALGRPQCDAMPGGLAPVGDLYDGEIGPLLASLAEAGARVPEPLTTGAASSRPSAEQAILRQYIECGRSIDEIAADGHDRDMVADLVGRVDRAESRRRGGPTALKVTAKTFGPGRRLPVARPYD